VFASKLGACCSLLLSPLKTKLTCCPLVVLPKVLVLEAELLLAKAAGRRSIQGTATCLPLLEAKLLPVPEDEPLGLVPLPELLEEPRLLPAELLEPGLRPELLDEPDPEDEPLGLVPLPELLEFSERIAKSIRPEAALMRVSLIVPSVSPEEPVTFAPINWLARKSRCPMRPVALGLCRELPVWAP